MIGVQTISASFTIRTSNPNTTSRYPGTSARLSPEPDRPHGRIILFPAIPGQGSSHVVSSQIVCILCGKVGLVLAVLAASAMAVLFAVRWARICCPMRASEYGYFAARPELRGVCCWGPLTKRHKQVTTMVLISLYHFVRENTICATERTHMPGFLPVRFIVTWGCGCAVFAGGAKGCYLHRIERKRSFWRWCPATLLN
jgi:hypothetical protein